MKPTPKVYVVVLNFKGWRDTLECLDSVYQLNHENFEVICVDNGSGDESVDRILAWAHARSFSLNVTAADGRITGHIDGNAAHAPFTLMVSGENLGYAGGNNLALRYGLGRGDCDYAWILNNDVVVDADSLSGMIAAAEANHWGICGARIVHHDDPTRVQAMAGCFLPYKGRNLEICEEAKLPQMTYVIGAAMLVSRACLKKTLLPEEHFLYFEEADFCLTARKAGIAIGVAAGVSIRHKDGKSSTQSLKEYYYARNLLHFVRKHMMAYLPFALWYVVIQRPVMKIVGGRSDALPFLFRGVRDFCLGRTGRMPG